MLLRLLRTAHAGLLRSGYLCDGRPVLSHRADGQQPRRVEQQQRIRSGVFEVAGPNRSHVRALHHRGCALPGAGAVLPEVRDLHDGGGSLLPDVRHPGDGDQQQQLRTDRGHVRGHLPLHDLHHLHAERARAGNGDDGHCQQVHQRKTLRLPGRPLGLLPLLPLLHLLGGERGGSADAGQHAPLAGSQHQRRVRHPRLLRLRLHLHVHLPLLRAQLPHLHRLRLLVLQHRGRLLLHSNGEDQPLPHRLLHLRRTAAHPRAGHAAHHQLQRLGILKRLRQVPAVLHQLPPQTGRVYAASAQQHGSGRHRSHRVELLRLGQDRSLPALRQPGTLRSSVGDQQPHHDRRSGVSSGHSHHRGAALREEELLAVGHRARPPGIDHLLRHHHPRGLHHRHSLLVAELGVRLLLPGHQTQRMRVRNDHSLCPEGSEGALYQPLSHPFCAGVGGQQEDLINNYVNIPSSRA
jgi:hypothetical protein